MKAKVIPFPQPSSPATVDCHIYTDAGRVVLEFDSVSEQRFVMDAAFARLLAKALRDFAKKAECRGLD